MDKYEGARIQFKSENKSYLSQWVNLKNIFKGKPDDAWIGTLLGKYLHIIEKKLLYLNCFILLNQYNVLTVHPL